MGTSLAVVNGNPAVTYTCSSDLKYARSATSTGANSADWSQIVVVYSSVVSLTTSLAVVDGNPAIGYCGWTGPESYALMYIRSTTATGTSQADWSQQVTIDAGAELVGLSASLGLVSGNPAIAYQDYTNSTLKYVRATTSTGADAADWSQLETVSGEGNDGAGSSLARINGRPAIAFRGGNDLMYAYYVP